MKKILLLFMTIIILSCGTNNQKGTVVKIGHVGESDRIIWKPVIEKLAKEGITVELVSFSDYTLPNQALNDGEIDLNAFQHFAYFNNELASRNYDLTAIGTTFISSMNIYSKNITNVSELKNDDKIAIPNDPANGGRALKVLEAAGLIKLRDKNIANPVLNDISENKLNLDIIEVDAGSIYSLLPDVACAVINCNFALNFGLNPDKDSIYKDNPTNYADKNYINLIAVREEDKDNEIYKKIVNAYQSDEVKEIYSNDFKGAYIAVW